MWATRNRTAYAVDSTWGRTRDGVHEWLVAVRASFDIKPDGRLSLSDEQPLPSLAPEYSGEDGVSSLRYEADLVAPKPTTDILLNGSAYAPGGRAARSFDVSMRVGKVHKTLKVHGRRVWRRGMTGLSPSTPEPVTDMPLTYERAYGGQDTDDPDPRRQKMDLRNPVGRGVTTSPEKLIGAPAHNIEYPTGSPEETGPASFGPIASYWSPRLELQGTYDAAWFDTRRPLLPTDWDPHSLLCSPIDQRPARHLRGGEPVELRNLTPTGELRFALPKIYLAYTTYISTIAGLRPVEHRGRLSSVIIEPDHPRVIMVWVTGLLIQTDVDYLEETVVREKPYI